ncbi:MAG: SDR family NAD(P)-dependent oxidoreductase, partial [Pseudomonadota bacterium]
LKSLAEELGGKVHVTPGNLSEADGAEAVFSAATEAMGGLDVLVNNAGMMAGAPGEVERYNDQLESFFEAAQGGEPLADPWNFLQTITVASWRKMIDVHLSGTFYCIKFALPYMSRGAAIINMASIGAVTGSPGVPHYSAAKAGICGLTRSLATEFGPKGIRINVILPGLINTPIADKISDVAKNVGLVRQAPLGRAGEPDEVASTALFLASDQGSYFTGQQLSPSGGLWM